MTSTESERLRGLSGESVREFLSNEITQILGRVAIELNGGEYKTLITHILMPVCIKAAITATEAALSDVPAPDACTCAKLNGQGICNGCATMLRQQVQRQREMNAEMAAAPDAGVREAAFETIDGEEQTHAMVVRNLAMLVRRLAHRIQSKYKAPDDAVAKQTWSYLGGEGLQGSVLRAALAGAAQPAPPKETK